MRINYSEWWNDVVAIGRANASILLAVAGAFAFLPALLASFALVPLVPPGEGANAGEVIAAYSQYFSDNWLTQLVVLVFSTLGQLLLYLVLLDDRRPRVGEAFRMAAPLFVPFLVTNLLVSLLLAGGFMLLVLPGLYLIGRVMLSSAAFVAERRTNPLAALRRSFTLTKRQGWRIFFFVFLAFLVALVIQLAVGGTLGTVLGLLAGGGDDRFSLGRLLLAALEAAFAALFFVLGVAIWVALYRRLTGEEGTSRAT